MVDHGVSALLVEARNPKAMADAAIALLALARSRAGAGRCGRRAGSRFFLAGGPREVAHRLSADGGWRGGPMTIYSSICSGLLFPLHERLKGHSSVAVRGASSRASGGQPLGWRTIRLERLRSFSATSGRMCRTTRRCSRRPGLTLQASGRGRSAAIAAADQGRHPRAQDSLKACDHGHARALQHRWVLRRAAGVSFIGKDRTSHDVGAKWRATRWWASDIGDTEMVIWGSPISFAPRTAAPDP